jgi:hypothetical protein
MSGEEMRSKLTLAIGKMPKWLRHDLDSADPALRQRAEESLVVMVLAVLQGEEAARGGD